MSHVGRPVPSEVPKWGLIVSTILLVLFASACYHYRAIPQRPASDTAVGGARGLATELEGEIVWALAWGLVQEAPRIDNCQGQDLAEVEVTSNLGFALLTIVTLGFLAPVKVEWRCGKPTPTDSVIGGDEDDEIFEPDSIADDTVRVGGQL